MKFLPTLLALSVAANAAFYFTTRAGSADTKPARNSAASRIVPTSNATAAATPRPAAAIWEKLRAGDPAALNDLRAAGWPEDVLRSVVVILVDDLFRDREAALRASAWADADYWKERSFTFGNAKDSLLLKREKHALLKKILGPDYQPPLDSDQRYAALSPEKAAAVAAINDDYQILRAELREGSELGLIGISLPEDAAKRALLTKEQRADLARALTPEELFEYDLRTSNTAATMRVTMDAFEPTEQEFRALFALQHKADEQSRTSSPDDPKISREERAKAKAEVEAQTKQLLGEQRYAELVRSRDNEYRRFHQIGQLLQLPPAAAVSAFEIKTDIETRARALKPPPRTDATATAAHNEAHLALAAEGETRLAAILGPRGFEIFQTNSTFLKNLRQTAAIKRPSKPTP
jgi:hypothetical protein